MKKFLVFALTAIMSVTAFGKTVDEVFNAFPEADNVQAMTLDKAMLAMARNAGGEQANQMKDIDEMRVIAIENATAEQIKIAKDLVSEGVDGFDVMVDADENGEQVLILTQGDEKEIHKMLIIAIEKEEVAVVLIKGKINPNDANKFMNLGK